ncbi:SDR family oxidoreductase [Algoriphagus sp. AK58]|uniref:dTDP-4-dehydrorhamnose reductase family protein n=1 Tax=Algoriphagus sp. AK58 TaxID=1406877 RepID=UPI00164F9B88|nr:SDR family oxidoreductase [Algoriphagus sp. AK58]MBC6369202.1 NAD(P)-dependent oxidoreductase [Algoriphagus sp. AK58]
MSKILVLGSTGMLGHQVFFKLNRNPRFEIFDISFRNRLREETIICDVTDFTRLSQVIKDLQPEFIINCIGILIKGSNENPKNSILINSYLPHFLVSVSDQIGAKVIHISTDCVFSGKKGDYVESDFRDADDIYGRTKALGEIQSEQHLTLRTSIIGPELKKNGEGLFHWFMNQSNEVNGFTKAFWGGVTTLELARVIEQSILNNLSGLFHVTNGESISKYELLNLFNKVFQKGLNVKLVEGKQVNKSLKTNFPEVFSTIPSYSEMIHEMKLFMDQNPNLYSNIYSNAG